MRILLTGATGLVGQGVLHEVLADASVTHIGLLGRRAVDHDDPRVQSLVVERFDELDAVADQLTPWDACFYCAGAPPVGTAERAYRHVTLDLTLHVARVFAERNPQGRFLYISGANANPRSKIMPLRIKGEVEAALQALPTTTAMLRPGGVQPAHGERSPHAWMRPMYAVGSPLMGLGVRLLPGLLTSTAAIGRTLLALAAMDDPPRVLENAAINRIAAGTQA
ncbi:NAD-dependent epimerase/dehydratase family protein [Thermomonas carbonis]|uniref:NAD-dependent epimerase/dehydratase family protein n=1 Tax=Thermomonas carbonis TaxID=1463158 RepID=A0A7G9SPK3_9GAMM|nr:NAD-dependent epimerase/dehydratase family protein [Thermomonas carbonis]QNN69778.1 NAD-dependent epimerase/dehydratase family protein [Thermomonas carbonis]GHB95428.1 epimerase [Thermomonas carbonis]